MTDENRGHDNSSTNHTPPADDKTPTEAELEGLTDEEKAELTAADDTPTDEGEESAQDAGAAKDGAADEVDLDDLPALDEGPAQIVVDPSDAEAQRWAGVDFSAEMKRLETEKQGLTEKHSNGEVSDSELIDQREALMERRIELRDRAKDVELYNARQADADNLFNEAQEAFFADTENAKYLENELLKGFFAQTMDQVARQDGSSGKSYLWLLQQTKRQVEIGLGTLRTKRDAADPPPPRPSRNKEEEKRLAESSKTLGNLPAADIDSGEESKWAHIDKMDITDMEHAIARMDDREANAFLAEH